MNEAMIKLLKSKNENYEKNLKILVIMTYLKGQNKVNKYKIGENINV